MKPTTHVYHTLHDVLDQAKKKGGKIIILDHDGNTWELRLVHTPQHKASPQAN